MDRLDKIFAMSKGVLEAETEHCIKIKSETRLIGDKDTVISQRIGRTTHRVSNGSTYGDLQAVYDDAQDGDTVLIGDFVADDGGSS